MAEPIIDFVQTWVDGSDPAWQQRRRAIDGAGDDSVARYRDWNLLHYWFRCVENFAPWVRHVYLITDQQCPAWLNREHPKLRLLDHRDYIPAEYLPTCNSNVLELNLHRIPDLAEQFVLFNDDFFLLRPAKPEDFFQNGLPVDDAILSPAIVTQMEDIGSTVLNNMCVINSHFDMKTVMKAAPGKWYSPRYGKSLLRTLMLSPWRHFPGFFNDHLPVPMLKSTFEKVWAAEPEALRRTCTHRLRDYRGDVNQWLMRYWQFAENRFVPASPARGRYLDVTDPAAPGHIAGQKSLMVCINDASPVTDFEATRDRIAAAFQSILPEPCSFEKPQEG